MFELPENIRQYGNYFLTFKYKDSFLNMEKPLHLIHFHRDSKNILVTIQVRP